MLSPQLLAGDGMMTQGRHSPVSWSLYSGDQGGGDVVLGIMEGFPEKEPVGQNSEGLTTQNERLRQGKQGPCGCVASGHCQVGIWEKFWATGAWKSQVQNNSGEVRRTSPPDHIRSCVLTS